MRKPMITIIALALAAVGLAAWAGDSTASPATSEAADAVDFEYVDFDGTTRHLSDFRGTPVVINFWASWCPACVVEMPDFAQVHDSFGGEVAFLGLNMQEVDRVAAEMLIDRAGITYALGHDPSGSIFQSFDGIAMPTTVFVAADGSVVETHAGALFADDLTRLIEQNLLA